MQNLRLHAHARDHDLAAGGAVGGPGRPVPRPARGRAHRKVHESPGPSRRAHPRIRRNRGTIGRGGEYEIAGRRIKYSSMSDFLKARNQIMAEVQREQAALQGRRGIPFGPKVLSEFR